MRDRLSRCHYRNTVWRFQGHDENGQASSTNQAGLNAFGCHILTFNGLGVALILTHEQYLGSQALISTSFTPQVATLFDACPASLFASHFSVSQLLFLTATELLRAPFLSRICNGHIDGYPGATGGARAELRTSAGTCTSYSRRNMPDTRIRNRPFQPLPTVTS